MVETEQISWNFAPQILKSASKVDSRNLDSTSSPNLGTSNEGTPTTNRNNINYGKTCYFYNLGTKDYNATSMCKVWRNEGHNLPWGKIQHWLEFFHFKICIKLYIGKEILLMLLVWWLTVLSFLCVAMWPLWFILSMQLRACPLLHLWC